MDNAQKPNLPLAFGMALAQNLNAMQKFTALPPEQQKKVIDKTHSVNSKSEMQQLVQQVADNQINF